MTAREAESALVQTVCLSADMAHAQHPNFTDLHDKQHAPLINQGIVVKANTADRYATTGETAALPAGLCEAAQVPLQAFVTRQDLGLWNDDWADCGGGAVGADGGSGLSDVGDALDGGDLRRARPGGDGQGDDDVFCGRAVEFGSRIQGATCVCTAASTCFSASGSDSANSSG